MAVDPKTGKPVTDTAPWPELAGLTREEVVDVLIEAALTAAEADLALPDAAPRGTSLLRGAYGPWLAAQEWAKAEAKRQP
jgi:hypothetical protein